MTVWPRGFVGAVLIGTLTVAAIHAQEDAHEPTPPAGEEPVPPSHKNAALPEEETPLADSIDDVVERFVREQEPCGLANGVPCFPSGVEREAVELSVEDAFRDTSKDKPPALPTVPTPAEMIQYGANPHPVAANVGGSTDLPCKAKHLFKKLTGKGRTYYVYRLWDETGVRGVLREEPLDSDLFAATPGFHYELVGRFGDECQALKAYRKIGHDERVNPSDPPAPSVEITTPDETPPP